MIDMMIMTSEMGSVAFSSVEPSLNWNCLSLIEILSLCIVPGTPPPDG